MRLTLVLVLLAFAAGHAHADETTVDSSVPTGGKHYLAIGMESVVLSTPSMTPDAAHAITIEAGHQVADLPLYLHVAAGATPASYVDTRAGIALRAGTVVKGVAGIDLGYQHDPRTVAMDSVEGPYVAPRIGLEVGTQKLWVRGFFDWRYTLARGDAGHATTFALLAGHDF